MRSFARDQHLYQIHGVSRRDCEAVVVLPVLGSAQAVQHFGQCELLSSKAADETSATDLSSIFKTTKHSQQEAPARSIRLKSKQVAEDNAVSGQQHPRGGLDCFILKAGALKRVRGLRRVRAEKRPSACGTSSLSIGTVGSKTAIRIDHRPQLIEAVRGCEPGSNQFP